MAIGIVSLAAFNVQASVDAQSVVREAANRVINVLETEGDIVRNDPDKIYQMVDKHILPLFDFERMSYYVLGRYWKQATDDQKHRFLDEFKHLLVNTYSTALSEYSTDEEIVYLPVQTSSNADVVIVPTEIRQKGSTPVPVAYRMYRSEGVWRIFDVAIDGVSLVTNYRANFSGQIRKDGLEGLIVTLGKHNKPKEVVNTGNH